MLSQFNRFTLRLTKAQAFSASHVGECGYDVDALADVPVVARQLRLLPPEDVRAELKEYGAWNAEELADDKENLRRVLWIAACDIREQIDARQRRW